MSLEPLSDGQQTAYEAELERDDVRAAAHAARTEDEYLEALREAGSLGAGMAIVATRPPLPPLEMDAAFWDHVAELRAGGVKLGGRWVSVHDFDTSETS